ncbi:MAG: autotransporter outer membrane beta-barrel domain-containing protein [Pseudomonadota bacterium]
MLLNTTAKRAAYRSAHPLKILLLSSVCVPIASAQEISTETSTPVTTSTINGGAAGDVNITEDGSIVLGGTEGQVAVTMDSDNSITHDGEITIDDTNNVTGILLTPGRKGGLTMSGSINLVEDYEREDDDDDDDLDGPLAIGENRIGLLLEAGGPHTGDINLQTGSAINVEGNDSAGIVLRSQLNGSFIQDGAMSVIGDDTIGLDIADGVTGDVLISGGISARGANARGASFDGDLGGNLTVESAISASGFANTGITNYVDPLSVTDDTPLLDERIDAEDLNDNGAALAIGGSIANGFLVNGAVPVLDPDQADDETKDTVEDFNENRVAGSIQSIGSAPAVQITPDLNGDAASNITLGTVVETVRDTTDDDDDDDTTETLATFSYEHGLINRGQIIGNGLNVGFDATALQISGSQDGDFTTTISGGILNTNQISAVAAEANATAIDLGAGAIIGQLDNDGTIAASTTTTAGNTATTLSITEGAVLSSINNSGRMTASSDGQTGTATVIQDRADTVTNVTNTGVIRASLSDDGVTSPDLEDGDAIALDFSRSTRDITVTQARATPVVDTNDDDVIDDDDVTTPGLTGNILFGSGNDIFTSTDGNVTGDVSFGLGDAEMTVNNTTLFGDISFSDGANTLSATASEITGDVSFGGASGVFNLNNSTFTGRILTDGTLNSFSAVDSNLVLEPGMTANMDTMSVTGSSVIEFQLDPRAANDVPAFTVADLATIGDGVTLRPDLQAIESEDFSYTIIDAGTLDFGGSLDSSLLDETPFIYDVALAVNDADRDTLSIEFSLKSAEQLGFDSNQSSAYSAVLDVFSTNDELGAALADITDEQEFNQVYDLLLPQRTDAATRYLSSQGTAAFGALGNRLDAITQSDDGNMGVWAQEYFTEIDVDTSQDVPGYNGNGLGFAAGYDQRLGFIDVVGVFLNYSSGDFEEKTGGTNPVTTSGFGAGLYTKESLGPLDFTFSGQYSKVDFNSRREVVLASNTFEQRGAWEGTSGMASASVSSRFASARFYARPKLSIDYFELSQDGYTETTTTNVVSENGADLALELGAADTDRVSAAAVLELGARLPVGSRSPAFVIPQVSLGYRSEISSTPYLTTARFIGSDESFFILSEETYSDAILGGVSLSTDSLLGTARFGYDVEVADESIVHFAGATLKLRF